jgi:hypothetical protein
MRLPLMLLTYANDLVRQNSEDIDNRKDHCWEVDEEISIMRLSNKTTRLNSHWCHTVKKSYTCNNKDDSLVYKP